MLLRFLTGYAYDPEMRSRFARSPDEVLDEYGVSREERELFKPLDLEKIQERMIEEVPEVLRRILDLGDEWKVIEDIYGPWRPVPRSISPRTGRTGTDISFVLTGLLLNFNAKVFFTRPGIRVAARNVSVNELGTTLRGTVKLSQAGEYNVVVDNGDGFLGTLVRGFTAT